MKLLINAKKLACMALLLSGSAYAVCVPAQKEQYLAISISSMGNIPDATNQLLGQYCYDFAAYQKISNEPPFFFSRSLSNLRLFNPRSIDIFNAKENVTGLDILSYFLIRHNYNSTISSEDRQFYTQLLRKYYYNVTESMFTEDINLVERKAILAYLAEQYKAISTTSRDVFGNSALAYAIITGEYNMIKPTLGIYSSNQALFRKNKDGLAPIHLVFFMDSIAGDKNQSTFQTNDMVLEMLDKNKLVLSKYKDMSFFEFAEMLKENNPDFYQKLQKKFNFTVASGNFKNYEEGLKNSASYIQRLKRLSKAG